MKNTDTSSGENGGRTKVVLLGVVAMLVLNGWLLTAWGWADWRGFFAHPARCALVALMAGRFIHLAISGHRNVAGRGRADKLVKERGFFLCLYSVCLLGLASPYFDARDLWVLPGGDFTRYAGLAIFVLGFALSQWAFTHLGRFFSGSVTLQEGHQLVTDGPFRLVRHPRYAGLMLVFIGIGLLFRSVTGVAAGLGAAALFLTRIPREETLMASEFGAAWLAYVRRTRRLLPGLY